MRKRGKRGRRKFAHSGLAPKRARGRNPAKYAAYESSAPQMLLGAAIREGQRRASGGKMPREAGRVAKVREAAKIKAISEYLGSALKRKARAVPDLGQMGEFERELIETFVSEAELKRACAQFEQAARVIRKIRLAATKAAFRGGQKEAAAASRAFIGRAASVMRKSEASFEAIAKFELAKRKMPSIDREMKTAVIAGYPNTGKSTIMYRLTGSAPKVADYPFTTRGIMVSYLSFGYRKVQVIDTPGLLDKPLGSGNKIERRAALALRHLADAVVFVIDPTLRCGFSLEEQLALFSQLKAEFGKPFIAAINKADVASSEEIERAKLAFGECILEGEGIESSLSLKIKEALLQDGVVS